MTPKECFIFGSWRIHLATNLSDWFVMLCSFGSWNGWLVIFLSEIHLNWRRKRRSEAGSDHGNAIKLTFSFLFCYINLLDRRPILMNWRRIARTTRVECSVTRLRLKSARKFFVERRCCFRRRSALTTVRMRCSFNWTSCKGWATNASGRKRRAGSSTRKTLRRGRIGGVSLTLRRSRSTRCWIWDGAWRRASCCSTWRKRTCQALPTESSDK